LPAADFPYRIQAFSGAHQRKQFSCGNAALDAYLHQQAEQDAKRHVAAPFMLTATPSNAVLGYYTLSSSMVDLLDLEPALAKKLPRYPNLPVILLGRLAVDAQHKGKGLGEFLLLDALQRCARSDIAAMAVIVDAKDENAKLFYQHFDFIDLQTQPMRLYLPMTTIKKLFSDLI
jgi:GNAT superfamily N-acetyltransferase